MNINLNTPNSEECDLQSDLDEHREILGASLAVISDSQVMLLSDPDYPGAYRVWVECRPPRPGQDPTWLWIDPDGELWQTQRPWAVK